MASAESVAGELLALQQLVSTMQVRKRALIAAKSALVKSPTDANKLQQLVSTMQVP